MALLTGEYQTYQNIFPIEATKKLMNFPRYFVNIQMKKFFL